MLTDDQRAYLESWANAQQTHTAYAAALATDDECRRLRTALQAIDVTAPDADGLVWVMVKYGAINIGTADLLVSRKFTEWKTMRDVALGGG